MKTTNKVLLQLLLIFIIAAVTLMTAPILLSAASWIYNIAGLMMGTAAVYVIAMNLIPNIYNTITNHKI